MQLSSSDLDHLAGVDDINDVLQQLLTLLGRDSFRKSLSVPQREEWEALAGYQRRLIIRIWAWSETQ